MLSYRASKSNDLELDMFKESQSEEMDDDDFEFYTVEDDSDDDDEDEEEEQLQKSNSKKLNQKQAPKRKSNSEDDSDKEEEQIQKQKKVKIPTKGADKSKEQTPKANTQSEIKENDNSNGERDLTTLFVENLPLNVTSDELRALSSDIVDVFMCESGLNPYMKYAFLKFASEEKAVANCKALQGTKLRGQVLKIAYSVEKNQRSPSSQRPVNGKELLINEIPRNATIADVATRFPKAFVVTMVGSELNRSATVGFNKKEDAAEAYNLKEIEIDGEKLRILLAPKFDSTEKYSEKGYKMEKFTLGKYKNKKGKKRKFAGSLIPLKS
ncbi:RRM domain-containing protein [Trichonephila clavipes]|nr:RRM domain-containing protein [Trichonephila clavipes]